VQDRARDAAGEADRSTRRRSTREQLVDLIGERATEKLTTHLGGRHVRIPVKSRTKARDARVRRLLQKHSYRTVARMVGLSPRQITRIAKNP
jgi:hypothetical protein